LTVVLLTPASGATVSGTVSAVAQATSGYTITQVQFSLDGTVVATTPFAPYGYSWDTTQTANGAHALGAKAFDITGNTAVAVANVTVQNDAGTCSAITASNYAHVQAGRAHDMGGNAYANGSNQSMGLDNTFYATLLHQTGPNYWVIGACP